MRQATYTAVFGAQLFGKSWSGISKHVERLQEVIDNEPDLADEVDSINEIISLLKESTPLLEKINHLSFALFQKVEKVGRDKGYTISDGEREFISKVLTEEKPAPKPKAKKNAFLDRLAAIREFAEKESENE